jgi:predicted cupin superfamily sugar epimerase
LPTAEEIISLLRLKPHPVEGGYFVETYRSDEEISEECLPVRYGGARSLGTAIYYLLTPDSFSAIHRLRTDEVFHHYIGDPVEMLQLLPDGSGAVFTLGPDLQGGMRPQVVVSAGVWQGARLRTGGMFALMGTTVSPGFDFDDYEVGHRESLLASYPQFKDLLEALVR